MYLMVMFYLYFEESDWRWWVIYFTHGHFPSFQAVNLQHPAIWWVIGIREMHCVNLIIYWTVFLVRLSLHFERITTYVTPLVVRPRNNALVLYNRSTKSYHFSNTVYCISCGIPLYPLQPVFLHRFSVINYVYRIKGR